jgi:hypothetical protein
MIKIWAPSILIILMLGLYTMPASHVYADTHTPRIVASITISNPSSGIGTTTALFVATRTGPYRLTSLVVISGGTPNSTSCGGVDYSFTDDYGTAFSNPIGDSFVDEVGVTRVFSAQAGTTVSYQLQNAGCNPNTVYLIAEEL